MTWENQARGGAGWNYHPLEIVVRTTDSGSRLGRDLAAGFARNHRVAWVRHGAEHPILGQEDGIWATVVANGKAASFVREGHFDLMQQRHQLSDADFVVVEARQLETSGWLVVELDEEGAGLESIPMESRGKIAALVGSVRPDPELLPPGGIPWFPCGELDELADHLLGEMEAHNRSRRIWGLILSGSGVRDSSEVVRALEACCAGIHLAQAEDSRFDHLPTSHPGTGVVGRILDCLQAHPGDAVLVVEAGQVDAEELLAKLICARDGFRGATAFQERDTHLPRVSPSIWEPKSRMRIHQAMALGILCPQKVLTHSHTQILAME